MAGKLSDFVSISVTRDTLGVKQSGFGVPLILSSTADWVERIRFYEDLSAVAADFATTDPEHMMAEVIFSRNPQVEQIAIGRCALPPTQKYTITPAVQNSTAYTVTINGTDYTYTSDVSASDTEIVDGLAALINAGSGDTLTATTPGSPGTETLVLTANAAGDWDAVQVADPALLAMAQDHADPGLATDLAAIAVEDNSWYFILYPFNSKACALAIAAWAEANKKLYVAQSCDTNNATIAIGSDTTTSLMGQVKTSAYDRTAVIYHPDPEAFADAAWVGKCGPFTPGSETWAIKTLSGVSASDLTSTYATNIENKYGNHYQTAAGVNVTQKGTVGSGEYIDVIRGLDWLEARMAETIFAHMAAAKKIAFTDAGISIVESDVRAVLDEGVANTLISLDEPYTVTVPKAASVSSANKSARNLPDVKFSCTLAGAIHKVNVTGVVSV